MTATDMHTTTKELLAAAFSVWSVLRLYNEDQLPLPGVERESAGSQSVENCSCEK
jgi:hypothetical protein